MNFSFYPGRGEVKKVLMKHSWIHSFCVAKQGEKGVQNISNNTVQLSLNRLRL